MRKAEITRITKETKIIIKLNLDGSGVYKINSGLSFLNHMLEQLSHHSLIDLEIEAIGDLHIDAHHTVEDIAISLGTAIKQALGDKKGINRFGEATIPMDETLTRAVIDICGRPYPVFNCQFSSPKIGDVDSELFREFFFAFANNLACNLHIENLYGINNHHKIESCFKALARALRMAISIDVRKSEIINSTKGLL